MVEGAGEGSTVKVVLSGGGTGGHVYPALSVAAALREELRPGEGLELLYLGSPNGAEREVVEQADIPFRGIASGPIRGRNPWELASNSVKIALGTRQARVLMKMFRPQVVLSTGGYASFPVALAARSRGIPLLLYLPDVYPGWAVRAIARLAQRICVSTPESRRKLPASKVVVTGYPVRPAFWQAERDEGRRRLGLHPEERVLFVAGASQGARSLNQAVANNLRGLLELCEVVHLSGRTDEAWLAQRGEQLPDALRSRYHLFGYLHDDLPWAMAAADLALCRAGASVLGELPAVGLPAVLVPYPYAGGHQRANARYLADHGAAVILEDRELGHMLPLVGGLLHDTARLAAMRAASHSLARRDAASHIAKALLELVEG